MWTWRRCLRAAAVTTCACFMSYGCSPPKAEQRSEETEPRWAPPPEARVGPVPSFGQIPLGRPFGGGDGAPPRASANYVFVANPEGRAVVIIDSRELTIRAVETGNAPTYLRTVPGRDAALVLNVGSRDASVVQIGRDGTPSHARLDVVKGANSIEMAPDGKHAVVFFDAEAEIAGEDFGDFQSVSVVGLASDKTWETTMTVGFKPERVVFQDDGERALAFATSTSPRTARPLWWPMIERLETPMRLTSPFPFASSAPPDIRYCAQPLAK